MAITPLRHVITITLRFAYLLLLSLRIAITPHITIFTYYAWAVIITIITHYAIAIIALFSHIYCHITWLIVLHYVTTCHINHAISLQFLSFNTLVVGTYYATYIIIIILCFITFMLAIRFIITIRHEYYHFHYAATYCYHYLSFIGHFHCCWSLITHYAFTPLLRHCHFTPLYCRFDYYRFHVIGCHYIIVTLFSLFNIYATYE